MRAFGGAEGIRTPDLLSAIQALSQLSYSPGSGCEATSIVPERTLEQET